MRKIILVSIICILSILLLAGCNRQIIDTTYRFDTAILSLPNGTIIVGKVQSWKDFDNSDQIQVKIEGKTYLIHSMNIALISG